MRPAYFFGFIVIPLLLWLVAFNVREVGQNWSVFGFSYGKLLPFLERDASQSAKTTVHLVGDVMLARNVEVLSKRNGFDYPYRQLNFVNSETDYLVGNFESAIPKKHQLTPSFTFNFSTDKRLLPALKEVGFTHLSLANNHTLDYGKDGYLNALSALSKAELEAFGHPTKVDNGSFSILEVGQTKIAIVGIHTVFGLPNTDDLHKTIANAEKLSDWQIAFVHWGDEYVPANQNQRNFAKKLIEDGVDLIVGHHPHIVQGVEKIDGVLVFYSLGNFIFDQYFSTAVQEGLLLSLENTTDKNFSMTLRPVTSVGSLSQPRLMSGDETTNFLNKLAVLSGEEVKEEIENGYFLEAFPLQLP